MRRALRGRGWAGDSGHGLCGVRRRADRTTRRGEEYLFDPEADAVLEEPERTDYVDVGVEAQLPNRSPHGHLGGLVGVGVGPELLQNVLAPAPDVPLVESDFLGNILPLPARDT